MLTTVLLAATFVTVGIVSPASSPAHLPQASASSVAAPSRVYPPDPRQWLALRVPGSRAVTGAGGRVAQVIELRGWLTFVGARCFGALKTPEASFVNDREPDWPYNLELDPAWLDHLGVRDPNTLIRAGNVVNFPLRATRPTDTPKNGTGPLLTGSQWSLISRPIVHVEVAAWDPERHVGQKPPKGWKSLGPLPGGCSADILWPYDPRNPIPGQPPLARGQYVRLVGSLVTDQPHTGTATEAAQPDDIGDNGFVDTEVPEAIEVRRFWELGRLQTDTRNLARWTEVHPPDTISVQAPRLETVTMRSVLVAPSPVTPKGSPTVLTAFVAPPGPKPRPSATVRVEEIIGAATRWPPGAPAQSRVMSRRVDVGPDGVTLHIAVGGSPRSNNPSRFQAVYRVSWR